jgi:hypothetical protein
MPKVTRRGIDQRGPWFAAIVMDNADTSLNARHRGAGMALPKFPVEGGCQRGTAMASLYTEAAERKRLAAEAMAKVLRANETATIPPAPSHKVRGRTLKAK